MAITINWDERSPCPMFKMGTIAFDDDYADGGEPLDLSQFFSKVLGVFVEPTEGFLFNYDADNEKVVALWGGAGESSGAGGHTHVAAVSHEDTAVVCEVKHVASPGGNEVYLKFAPGGFPYLCCNMANEAADMPVAFTDGVDDEATMLLVHDAGAATGIMVKVDDSGADPILVVDATALVSEGVLYVPSLTPGRYLPVVNSDGGGDDLFYDDDSDDRLECALTGEVDVDIPLVELTVTNATEEDHTHTATVTALPEVTNHEDIGALDAVRFFAWGVPNH